VSTCPAALVLTPRHFCGLNILVEEDKDKSAEEDRLAVDRQLVAVGKPLAEEDMAGEDMAGEDMAEVDMAEVDR